MSPFEPDALVRDLGLNATFMTGQAEGCLQLRIDNIKVEFLRHADPKLADDDHLEGIRLWSLQDVAAMKLNAIANRGSKKDFYDIVALLEHFALQSMIDLYQVNYRPASLMMVIKSLAWFVDADAEPDPITLRDQSWHEVKEIISSAIRSLR